MLILKVRSAIETNEKFQRRKKTAAILLFFLPSNILDTLHVLILSL